MPSKASTFRPPHATSPAPVYESPIACKWAADKLRGTSAQRGYDATWRRLRKSWLVEHPLCEHCRRAGITRFATEVDHVIRHEGDAGKLYDRGNLQSLCKSCHSRKTQKEQREYADMARQMRKVQ